MASNWIRKSGKHIKVKVSRNSLIRIKIPDLKKTQRRARRTKVILSSVSVKQKIGRIESNRLETHHSEVKVKSIESKKSKKSIKVRENQKVNRNESGNQN